MMKWMLPEGYGRRTSSRNDDFPGGLKPALAGHTCLGHCVLDGCAGQEETIATVEAEKYLPACTANTTPIVIWLSNTVEA